MRAIADQLFTDEPQVRLIGGRNLQTGRIVFPCPENRNDWEPVPLGRTGTLWSYTVQRYRPKTPPYKGPADFTPWVVAYVELPGEVIVEARLDGVAFEDVKIGMALELVQVPLDPDAADPVLIPAFRATGDAA